MRILMKTEHAGTERRFLNAARMRGASRLSVLHSEAQVLERLFRDPFDALIADTSPDRVDRLRAYAPRCPDNLFLLLPARASDAPLPTAVVFGFPDDCTADAVLERVEALSDVREQKRLFENAVISAALQRIGVPVHLKGFSLLKEAIRLTLHMEQPVGLRMTEDVYALLASYSGTTGSVVEHAMRHAIETAWLRADARVLERMFGYTVSAERATPSNAAFLFQMREHIRIGQRRGKQYDA